MPLRAPLLRHPLLAALAAALGGLLLDAASPGLSLWAAAPVGVALVLAALWGRRPGAGALLGALAGAAFWFPHISWLTLYLGLIPWLALGTVMTAWWALLGAAVAAVTRWLPALPAPRWLRAALTALAVAGLWVAKEQGQSVLPYGGFAWGRLAHTQANGPLIELVSWLGFAGFSGLLALLVALPLAVAALREPARGEAGGQRLRAAVPAVAAVAALGLLATVPAAPQTDAGSARVLAVQGNADAGIFADRAPGDIFSAHASATLGAAEDAAPDVILWPENAADVALRDDPYAASVLDSLSERFDAPIVTGTILRDPDGAGERLTNSAVLWEPGAGITARYDKRRPVPFAEYMPNRAFYRAIVPELIDLVQLEYAFGDRPSVLDIDGLRAGIAICFDIIFDDQAVAMSAGGAEIVFAPTNNADFGHTDESAQQLAIARLRAVEMGRTLVNVSTVGTSAVVAPTGELLAELTPFTADTMLVDAPLRTGVTPALRWGAPIAGALIAAGLLGLGAAGTLALLGRGRRGGAATLAE